MPFSQQLTRGRRGRQAECLGGRDIDIEETFPQSPVRLESLQKPMPTLRIFQGEPHEMWLVVAQVR
jgi:hypothetical protein